MTTRNSSSICSKHLSNWYNDYEFVEANQRGHFPIPQLGIELGIWHGRYNNMELPWLL
ncbi:MAG: hypothetical protein F6K17_13365 [Okeania sp. SIO3C4]|nr:hypothetical protein [Okeania sp. SIO3B3]NER03529.1 hypothetical protein [Okeania sp. SIO3C4]